MGGFLLSGLRDTSKDGSKLLYSQSISHCKSLGDPPPNSVPGINDQLTDESSTFSPL